METYIRSHSLFLHTIHSLKSYLLHNNYKTLILNVQPKSMLKAKSMVPNLTNRISIASLQKQE